MRPRVAAACCPARKGDWRATACAWPSPWLLDLRKTRDLAAPLVRCQATSRGRLQRGAAPGKFAVTAEMTPPDSADPKDLRGAPRSLDGVRRDQRHRRLRRQLPNVERRRLRLLARVG